MAVNAAQIQVILNANVAGFANGLKKAENNLERFEKRARGAEKYSKGLAQGLAVVGTAMGALGLWAITAAGKIEQTEIAFTTLLGSASAAKVMIKDLQEFAARTPFQFQGLADSARLLVTMGMNAQETLPIIRTVADAVAAAGGGQEELMGVARALGQIQAKGKVSAEELMQLAERGIPAQKILQEELGLTGEQVANIGNQGITAEQGIAALLNGLTKRFKGAAEEQSKTILGMWSTLKDNVTMTLVPLGQLIIDTFNIKEAMQKAIEWLERLRKSFEAIRDTIEMAGVRAAIENFIPPQTKFIILGVAGAIVGALIPSLYAAWQAFKATAKSVIVSLGPFALYGAIAAGAAYLVWQAWEPLGDFFKGLWGVIVSATMNGVIKIGQAWNELKRVIYGVVKNILDAVAPLLEWLPGSLGRSFTQMRNEVTSKLRDIETNLSSLSQSAEANAQYFNSSFKKMSSGAVGTWNTIKDQFTRGTSLINTQMSFLTPQAMETMSGSVSTNANIANTNLEKMQQEFSSTAGSAKSAAGSVGESMASIAGSTSLAVQIAEAKLELWKLKMGENINQSQLLQKETAILRMKIEEQQKQVDAARIAYEKSVKVKGEAAEATQRLQLEYINAQIALEGLKNKLAKVSEELEEQTDKWKHLNEEARKFYSRAEQLKGEFKGRNAGVLGALMAAAEKNISKAADIGKVMGGIKGFATGGIIKRPVMMSDLATGMPVGVAGEAGPEAIVPMNGGGKGGNNLTFNIYETSDPNETARQVVRILKRQGVS